MKRKPLEDIEMLSQPLMTEEGFLNEACMNEMEAWVRNTPECYERLKDDPEWSALGWVICEDIVGALAMCAIRQYQGTPPKLEQVTSYLHACLRRKPFAEETDGYHMAELSLCDINRLLWDYLGDLEGFNAWGDKEKVGSHWISLSALLRNVCHVIRGERRQDEAFERKLREAER